MDTNNYMTNTSEVDLTDDEMIKKNAQLTKDNEAYQQELEKKKKEIMNFKENSMLCRSNMIISSKQQKTTKTYFHFTKISLSLKLQMRSREPDKGLRSEAINGRVKKRRE